MRLSLPFALLIFTTCAYAQQDGQAAITAGSSQSANQAQSTDQAYAELPDAPEAGLQQTEPSPPAPGADTPPAPAQPQPKAIPPDQRQPKRILGLMPNYRAVSAGAIPPPPTPKEAFKIATYNSFDYSAFVFTALTSMIAEGEDDHPALGKGIPGFWAYLWRGFLDKTDGNYWVIFALPTVFHEDERYYALGKGPILKRALYAVSRVAITPNYSGHDTINGSELLGRGIAQAISISYYPSSETTANDLASKYGYAVLRDAATNAFREFWPDISVHVLHRAP